MFRRVILAGASVIALAAAANAADLSKAPSAVSYKDTPYYGVNWSGLYVGVNGGYGWDASNIGSKLVPGLGVSPEGGFGGGQIGYNVQQGNIVFGVEADLQAAGITDSKSQVLPPNAPANVGLTIGNKSTLDWFGTVRGRVGYTFDRTLVYATGGLAYGHIGDETSCSAGAQALFSCTVRALGSMKRTQRATLLAAVSSTSSMQLGRPRRSISTSTSGKTAFLRSRLTRITRSPRFGPA